VGDVLQDTRTVSYGDLCSLKRRDPYPFSNGGLRQEDSIQKEEQALLCVGTVRYAPSEHWLFEVSGHGWGRSSGSIRAIAPAGCIVQRVATEEPCTLAYVCSPLLGLTGTP